MDGVVCQAVRAPGSKVTLAPCTRGGIGGPERGGRCGRCRVNQSAGPLLEGLVPARWMSMGFSLHVACADVGGLGLGVGRVEVLLDGLVEDSSCVEDKVDGVAAGALASGGLGVM